MPRFAHFAAAMLFLAYIAVPATSSAPIPDAELERQFTQTVRPFMAAYCTGCHSGAAPAASLDLQQFTTVASVVRQHPHWALVMEKLSSKEMPPKQMKQPTEDARRQVIAWIAAVRKNEALKNAGDPGTVLARRLSNAEYNYTIRDLTGADLRPAREFPIDPANESGFDNSGESLTLSPALMTKYLEAARQTADHLVLKPDGFSFAPFPMLVETDREKYPIQRIVDFYERQPTKFSAYFHSAWRYKYRAALGQPKASLANIAAETKVSLNYLNMVWNILEQTKEEVGPLVKLQAMWRALPVPTSNQPDMAKEGCVRMGDFVLRIRRHTEKLFNTPQVPAMNVNFQPFVIWRNREIAANRRDFDPAALRVVGEPPPPEMIVTRGPTFGNGEQIIVKKAIADYIKERLEDPDLIVPAGERARYEAAFSKFSSVFPTGFYLRERGRFYPVDTYDQGRYLGAGFHNVMGYFRDDKILSDLILDDEGKKELDSLWHEFDFIADYNIRTWNQFVFNGGGGGGRGVAIKRPSFKEATTEATIFGMRDQYLKAAPPDNLPVMDAINTHFANFNKDIRWVEQARLDAEPRHLEALVKFAARAYRRTLVQEERDEIRAYYHELRKSSSLTHEAAMRGSIISLLVSPDFLYRVDLIDAKPDVLAKPVNSMSTVGARQLSSHALASRLSYFLWSSMPDEELTAHAEAGDLSKPTVLLAQVRRMLKDGRVSGLATEFAGNWLDIRHFEGHNAVDRNRFPTFNNQLRLAMFEEPIRFIVNLMQNDRPVLDLLYGKYTFVNPVLAEHYGMPAAPQGSKEWIRVDDARAYGRGGFLPMAVFLTKNSPGLRTSPVKRGYWVARRVLGEVIPPPPPVVPELPQDESKSDLPLRAMLAKHRENAACAGCHARFDSFGLAFEGYGPVGEKRTKDLAGRPVDTNADFPRGNKGAGLDGLETYIRNHREKDFLNNLSEKLLVFALARSPQLFDDQLLEQMRTKLSGSGYRFSALVESIVTSPQFLNRRNPDSNQQKGE